MTAAEKVLAIARAEIGYCEKKTNAQLDDKTANAGSNNYTKYARDLDQMGMYNGKKQGYAWCDVFADWCYIQAFGLEIAIKITGQPMGGLGAGCKYSANYYKQMGRFFTTKPQPGDQIFFSSDGGKTMYHTGIVSAVSNGKVYTIEGNTSSAPGVVSNGGMVAEKSYNLNYSKIGGYGRPNWALVPDVEEKEPDIVTQERFNAMMDKYLEDRAKQAPSEWSANDRAWAEQTGIIQGDDKGDMQYKSYITKEQLAAVLHRYDESVKQ